MAVSCASPEQLLKDLKELDTSVQRQVEEDQSFRRLNANFSVQNETTQMLLEVCEKLAAAKEAMERACFEEHTSELPYLCRHFGTAIDAGLSERAYRERQAAQHPSGVVRRERRRGGIFSFCCQHDFPPRQSWWTELSKRLTPTFQVVRAGRILTAFADELVTGDLVYLCAGQRVALDGRVLVYTAGTALDVSQLTFEMSDVHVRVCSAGPTAEAITASRNMVFKDSYVVAGSLFCMAVRAAVDSFIPSSAHETETDQFTVDVNLPTGMTMSQCKSTFKALCVQARLACRSFQTLLQVGRAGTLVVLLTKELISTALALCNVTRRLGRALILVDCDCTRESLEALSKESGLEVFDVGASPARTVASTPVSTRSLGASHHPLQISEGELERLSGLTQQLSGARDGGKGGGGAIITRISQPGLTSLCCQLADAGMPPLYAMGSLDFPDSFRSLVLPSRRSRPPSARTVASSSATPPRASLALDCNEGQSILPPQPQHTRAAPTPEVYGSTHLSHILSQASEDYVSHDPAANLRRLRSCSKKQIELLISLNSIGVVSENADCVLLKPDLGCLGQALEIIAKAVPPMLVGSEEAKHA
mmetsp:Transcript_77248/g.213645  ORF Transcript_77248/g.213645 Transcript_77248/m.213645 type:complete len:593 (-) Transcript_77248:180-1958(-)